MKVKNIVVGVDIDGYIAERTREKSYEFSDFKPILSTIKKVNDLFRKGYVIIYHTARHPKYYEVTFAWLIQHGCEFHALRMGKMPASFYLDDKNANIDDL